VGYRLPLDVKNALIEVCGSAFWYKRPLFDVFARAGIREDIYLPYEAQSKYKIARLVLQHLEVETEEGKLLQKRLVTELCRMRNVADDKVVDREKGLDALRKLKAAAMQHHLLAKQELTRAKKHKSLTMKKVEAAAARRERLNSLHKRFSEMLLSTDHQQRGYDLEGLLTDLFTLYEIGYRKPYRTAREQIDGAFSFEGFDYLVEARWRRSPPSLDQLAAFQARILRKIESTRGLFISVAGFNRETLDEMRAGGRRNLLLMDGQDLVLVLEGRVNLRDGLKAKAEKAAQEGIMLYPLKNLV